MSSSSGSASSNSSGSFLEVFFSDYKVVVEKILPRKKVSLVSALAGLLFSILLVILIRYAMTPHFLVIIFSLLGLNSFLGSVLFFFMFLQAV